MLTWYWRATSKKEELRHSSEGLERQRHELQRAQERDHEEQRRNRQELASARFGKALELLTNPDTALGAIFLLEEFARDDEKYHEPVVHTLTAKLREELQRRRGGQLARPLGESAEEDEGPPAPWTPTASNALQCISRLNRLEGRVLQRPVNLQGEDLRGESMDAISLPRANLDATNLNEASLSDANLTWARLRMAKLRGARLSWANLSWADLEGAALEGANLRRSNLEEASLGRVKLRGANLGRATLRKARLVQADLRQTNLDGAEFKGANLDGANLEGAHRLPTDLSIPGWVLTDDGTLTRDDGRQSERDTPPDAEE